MSNIINLKNYIFVTKNAEKLVKSWGFGKKNEKFRKYLKIQKMKK